ncbi:hypothetical protein M378DRAFT_19386, partial [Amanita muscaria Koide BX008]
MDAAISNGTDLAQSTESLLSLTTAVAAANAEFLNSPSAASSITLLSTTDSSMSSALSDSQSKPHEQSSNALSTQLNCKLLYREMTGLESRIKQEDTQDNSDEPFETRILIKGCESEITNEMEKVKWN